MFRLRIFVLTCRPCVKKVSWFRRKVRLGNVQSRLGRRFDKPTRFPIEFIKVPRQSGRKYANEIQFVVFDSTCHPFAFVYTSYWKRFSLIKKFRLNEFLEFYKTRTFHERDFICSECSRWLNRILRYELLIPIC